MLKQQKDASNNSPCAISKEEGYVKGYFFAVMRYVYEILHLNCYLHIFTCDNHVSMASSTPVNSGHNSPVSLLNDPAHLRELLSHPPSQVPSARRDDLGQQLHFYSP